MAAKPEPAVLWREGMFLRPQHMQAFSREVLTRISGGESAGRPGNHGLLALSIDEDALERDELVLLEARAVFPDGALADFPGNASVEQRSFAEHFTGSELEAWLGIPAALPNVPQITEQDGARTRYSVESRAVHDENLRDAPAELEFRRIQGRLFFGDEDRSGHECLPIARLVRRGQPEATSALSLDWIAPVLACGASAALVRRLQEMLEHVRGQARDLAARMPQTASLSSVEKGADLAGFVKLQAANRCVASLTQIAGLPGLHPLQAYLGLVHAVGDLAVFGDERVVPDLPLYDHGDANGCFAAVFSALRALLKAEVAVPYDAVPLPGDPLREGFFEGEIPREWVEKRAIFYLAVELAKPADEALELVRTGVKLVAPADIERVLQGVVPGIGLEPLRTPPLSFPKRADLHFFRIQGEGTSRDSWLRVLEERRAVVLSALGGLEEVGFQLFVELPE